MEAPEIRDLDPGERDIVSVVRDWVEDSVHGGYGFSAEFDIERYYRDAPADGSRRGHQRHSVECHHPTGHRPVHRTGERAQ